MPEQETVGYAVVGLGWISQAAMLPAFANVADSSRLAALVSGSPEKRRGVAGLYGLDQDATYDYDAFEECLDRDDVHAVYVAVPNHLHREYTVRAAEKGVHVLCEKPMAPTAEDCRAMIEACDRNGVKLMVAYRLHLEPAHLRAIELVRSGAIGDPRIFSSTFTQQVDADDVRMVPPEKGGGALYDIGVYCINAARYLFGAEPERVRAAAVRRDEKRFAEIEEAMSCVLTFPGERLAAFTVSFGASAVSELRLVGAESDLWLPENAYEFQGDRELFLGGRDAREAFPETDQFGAQLAYFSRCIREDLQPEPDGEEGLIDVMIIRTLYESLAKGTPVDLRLPLARTRRPDPGAVLRFPAVEEPEMVGAESPGS